MKIVDQFLIYEPYPSFESFVNLFILFLFLKIHHVNFDLTSIRSMIFFFFYKSGVRVDF